MSPATLQIRPGPRARRRAAALLIATAVLGTAGCNASNGAADHTIRLSGTVEAHETDLAFLVAGRITALHTEEGDQVTAGAPIADLDPTDYQIAAQRAQAEADAAQNALAALQAGTRPQELRVAEATLAQAQAQLAYARADERRIQNLAQRHLASPDQLDQARLRKNVAQATADQARENLALLREGPRRQDIDQAAAQLTAARKAAESARRQLAHTHLISPVTGVVTVRMAEVGEVVAPGTPIVRVAELRRPWVRAYLSEVDLSKVHLGQAVDITADGLPGKVFHGRLSFIAQQAEFTPKNVETKQLRVDLVYRIKVDVDNPDGILKLGMPVEFSLQTAPAS